MKQQGRVLIIDQLNLFFRNYIVNPSLSQHGFPIGALRGCIQSLQKIVRETKPDMVVICWDGEGGSKKRKLLKKDYKAGRKPIRLNRSIRNLTEQEEVENKVWQQMRLVEYYNELPIVQFMFRSTEADDIIATLCHELEFDNGKTLILSGDKDFVQLQKYTNVSQYSPITKKFVNGIDPNEYLYEHVLKGDTGDGVPNVLSPDNTFVDGLRQKPLSKKKIAEWAGPMCEHALPDAEIKRNYQRNKKLIDLTESPNELFMECKQAYDDAPDGDRSKLLNYFIKNRLQELMNSIGDF